MSLVSPSQSNPGDEVTAAAINNPINQLAAVINGGIDVTNFAPNIYSSLVSQAGWNDLNYTPATVTANGNRSYDMVFASQDLTGTLSAGMRLRTTRTVAAPTQSTSLNGTSQYYSKSAPAGMTFTDDFVAGAWIKISSYTTAGIISRYNGTSGWYLGVEPDGKIALYGHNAGAANFKVVQSYQSIPLNKWVHVTAQLDMSAITVNGTGLSSTTNYIMIDGVEVPATTFTGGTGPTALINNVGNLEVGSRNAGSTLLPGKIAQAFVSSAKITQANVRTLISQGLTSALITTHNIVSAYSFNGVITDLNTTNANNLTANGSAVATNADSPFGGQADGTISSTLDYAIVQKATFSTNTTVTVQVPEGCTIPTSGGVTSVVYSSNAVPYGFPKQTAKWQLESMHRDITVYTSTSYGQANGRQLSVPIGQWDIAMQGAYEANYSAAGAIDFALSTSTTSVSDIRLSASRYLGAAGHQVVPFRMEADISVDAQTNYYAILKSAYAGQDASLRGDGTPTRLTVQNALL